ncbi:hypothetical protein HK098_003836 [Nowakowskiella sp. JEL0407]|nr:hypothetical protein HK098_003836 [Nowakowskiella sp. JEL0407]
MKFLQSPLVVLTTAISCLSLVSAAAQVGVGVGTSFGHRPYNDMVGSLHAANVAYIKMWNFDTTFLDELKRQYGDGNVKVTIAIPNGQLDALNNDQDFVNQISQNLKSYSSIINFVCIGNEPTLNRLNPPTVVAAFKKMVNIVQNAGLGDTIKVTIPHSADMMTNTYPPNGAIFTDIGKQYMNEVLPILRQTGSVFSVNLYPYFNNDVPLTDRLGKGLWANSLFRNMLLATRGALTNAGFSDIPIIVGETGWPTSSGQDASVQNANDYMHHAVDVARTDNLATFVYLFEMFDEPNKPDSPDEKFFGIQDYNGNKKFDLDVSGSVPVVVKRPPPTSSGWGWDFYDGYDITAHDLGSRVASESSTNCQPYCRSIQGCVGYAFSNGWCYLKSGPASSLAVIATTGVNAAILNPIHNIPANPSFVGYGWEFYDNIDIPGHDLSGVARYADNTGTRSGCQTVCGNTSGCIGYTWSDGWCYFKGGQRADISEVKAAPGLYTAFMQK